MFTQIFAQVYQMSGTASFVILFILLARMVLRKAPKSLSYALWGVVLFRLICPWSFTSALSLLAIGKGNPVTGMAINSGVSSGTELATASAASTNELVLERVAASGGEFHQGALAALPQNPWAGLWLIGVGAFLISSVVSLLKLKKQLQNAERLEKNIYTSARVTTPFVMGVVRPRIYLPECLGESEKQYVLLHEQVHIRRLDHVTRFVSFLVLCVHWFNPLVWAAFYLSGKDMEMSCDEAVVKTLGSRVKREYSTCILALCTGRRLAGNALLAFSQGGIKGRIKNVLNYQKRPLYVQGLGLLLVVAISVLLAANPVAQAIGLEADALKFQSQPIPVGTCYYNHLESSRWRDDLLSERMGFAVCTPSYLEGLDGEQYMYISVAEGFGTSQPATPQTWRELIPDVRKAMADYTALDRLSEYGPYPMVSTTYRQPDDLESMITISIVAADSPKPWGGDVLAHTATKVGDHSAWWLDIEYPTYDEPPREMGDWILSPQGVQPSNTLTWNVQGVRYDLVTGEAKLTMEEAMAIAESYMSKQ